MEVFDSTILHCVSSKKTAWEQFSSNIATALICLATNRMFNFSKMIFDGMVKNLESKHKFLMASKDYTRVDIPLFPVMIVQGLIFQGEGSTVPVESRHILADKAASTGVYVRHEGAATTVTSLDAGHGSGNIGKTPSMPHDSPLLRVSTLGSNEGSMILKELTVLCTTLSQKVESLEEDLKQTKKVYGAAYTKLIIKVKKLEKTVKISKARRKAKIVVSDKEVDLEDPSKQGRSMIEDID
nr:synaptobrevin, longin-like domain protein [Tanacetum cinerariifolium]